MKNYKILVKFTMNYIKLINYNNIFTVFVIPNIKD